MVRITSPGNSANGSAVLLSRDTDENHGTSILQFLYKIAYRHKNENVAKQIHTGLPTNDDLKLFKYEELKVDFRQRQLNKF